MRGGRKQGPAGAFGATRRKLVNAPADEMAAQLGGWRVRGKSAQAPVWGRFGRPGGSPS